MVVQYHVLMKSKVIEHSLSSIYGLVWILARGGGEIFPRCSVSHGGTILSFPWVFWLNRNVHIFSLVLHLMVNQLSSGLYLTCRNLNFRMSWKFRKFIWKINSYNSQIVKSRISVWSTMWSYCSDILPALVDSLMHFMAKSSKWLHSVPTGTRSKCIHTCITLWKCPYVISCDCLGILP